MDNKQLELYEKYCLEFKDNFNSTIINDNNFGYLHIYGSESFNLFIRYATGLEFGLDFPGSRTYDLNKNIHFMIYQANMLIDYIKSNYGLYFKKEYNFKDYSKNVQFSYGSYDGKMQFTIDQFNVLCNLKVNKLEISYRQMNYSSTAFKDSNILEDVIYLCYFIIDILSIVLNTKHLGLNNITEEMKNQSKIWMS